MWKMKEYKCWLLYLTDLKIRHSRHSNKSMEVYKITLRRVLSYFGWPLFGLILILAISYYLTRDFSILYDNIWVGVFSFLFLFWTLPAIILLINHYIYLKGTIFEYDELQEEFYYSNRNESLKFKKADIAEIIQYNNGGSRIPWGDIYIWEIYAKGQHIKLTSILISKMDFIKMFWDKKIDNNFKFFVTM